MIYGLVTKLKWVVPWFWVVLTIKRKGYEQLPSFVQILNCYLFYLFISIVWLIYSSISMFLCQTIKQVFWLCSRTGSSLLQKILMYIRVMTSKLFNNFFLFLPYAKITFKYYFIVIFWFWFHQNRILFCYKVLRLKILFIYLFNCS